MKVNRAALLLALRSVSVGLSNRELLEQSNNFIFTENDVVTFNGEILARFTSPLKGMVFAIIAADFLNLIEKFPEEELEIELKEGEVRIVGMRRTAGVKSSVELRLPVNKVPVPKEWNKLTEGIEKTLQRASQTCGTDQTQILATCVHITPSLIEASDNHRLFRCKMKTGFIKEILIPSSSVEVLKNFVLTHSCLTDTWVHFKCKDGLIISMRCFNTEYHKGIDGILKIEGDKVELPSNLDDILERAAVMNEGGIDAFIDITFREGRIEVMSRKVSGWYKEEKRSSYVGRTLSFRAHPQFLKELFQMTKDVIVNKKFLKVETGNIEFLVALTVDKETSE